MSRVNLFFIGEPKCGTTVMYEYFKGHRDCFVPEVKEPRHFCDDFFENTWFSDAFCEYKSLWKYENLYDFSQKKRYFCDFTPQYLYSAKAAANIYHYNPDAKIIAIFREPVAFLKSLHAEGVKVGVEKVKDFKKALEVEGYRRNNLPKNIPYPQRLFYSDWVKYAEQLLRFLSLFPKEQVKVILYEEFKENNQNTVDDVCEFLNIQKISIQEKTANVRMQPRFPVVTRFLYQSYVMFYALVLNRLGQKSLPVRLSKSMGGFLRKISLKETNKTWTDPALEAKLRRQFKAEVVKFNHLLHEYSLTTKDVLTFWGYDKV